VPLEEVQIEFAWKEVTRDRYHWTNPKYNIRSGEVNGEIRTKHVHLVISW